MATRKDLLKAYGFTSQRLIKALVDRNPEDMSSPLRRVAMGSFASVMVGVLMFAGFGVVGWLNPAKTSKWQKDKTVVVDKTSGGVFAYLENTLYPAYNITSAKLATAGGPTVSVTTKSLRSVSKLGTTIGIPGAPNQLPDPSAMVGYPIRLCASAPQGGAARFTTIEIGQANPTPADNPTVLVADEKGGQYLVIDGVAHLAPVIKGKSIALDLGFTTAITPGNAFVNGLPKGVSLDPPRIDGLGGTSTKPVRDVTAVGTLLQLTGTQPIWFVLLSDGYAPISPIEARSLSLQGSKTVKVDLATITAATQSRTTITGEGLPAQLPTPTAGTRRDTAVCETWTGGPAPQISLDVTDLPAATTQAKNPNQADLVVTPPLGGVLLQPDSVVDPAANITLITSGLRYGLADADARAALGYADTPVRQLPDGLVELIPQGLAAGEILSIPRAQQRS